MVVITGSAREKEWSSTLLVEKQKRSLERYIDVELVRVPGFNGDLSVIRYTRNVPSDPELESQSGQKFNLLLLQGLRNLVEGELINQVPQVLEIFPQAEIYSVHYSYEKPWEIEKIISGLTSLLELDDQAETKWLTCGLCMGGLVALELIHNLSISHPEILDRVKGAYLISPVVTDCLKPGKARLFKRLAEVGQRVDRGRKPFLRMMRLLGLDYAWPGFWEALLNYPEFERGFKIVQSDVKLIKTGVDIGIGWVDSREEWVTQEGQQKMALLAEKIGNLGEVKDDFPGKHGTIWDSRYISSYSEEIISFIIRVLDGLV